MIDASCSNPILPGYVSAATHEVHTDPGYAFFPSIPQVPDRYIRLPSKSKPKVTFDGMTQADYLKKDGIKRRTKQKDYL